MPGSAASVLYAGRTIIICAEKEKVSVSMSMELSQNM
jgi:hypothetical protein